MSHAFGWIVAALIVTAPAPEATPSPAVPSPAVPTPVAAIAGAPGAVADLRPMEVRIRKLYLVRPDLLQFPNPYEVVC